MYVDDHRYGYDGYGDIWSDIMHPIKHVGGQIERHVIRPIAQPISHIATQIEKHVVRPIIGSKGIGRPLATAAKQIEKYVIRPTLGKAIAPIAKIMPKITIGGHRYDLGGHQLLQKTVTGAVGGTITGGFPYGTVAGALAGAIQKGAPDVMQNLQGGVIAGVGVKVGQWVASKIPIPGTGGMSPSDMIKAGASPDMVAQIQAAAAAPGGLANPANAQLMPSVGTVSGTGGMTVTDLLNAGISPENLKLVLSKAAQLDGQVPIPGTGGMTVQDMYNAEASPQQVSQIIDAANAPGGLANPANARLMPDIGTPSSSITPIQAAEAGLTAEQVAQGLGVAATGVGLAKQMGLIKDKQPGSDTPLETIPTEASLISSPYFWILGAAAVMTGLVIYKRVNQ